MKFLDRLLYPLGHCEDAAYQLLQSLGVKVSSSVLQNELQEHPNYPSLLSIMDILRNYGVESAAAKLSVAEWENTIAPPFLVHVQGEQLSHNLFFVVKNISGDMLEVYDTGAKENVHVTKQAFEKKFRGTVLVANPNEGSGEKDYEENIQQQKRHSLFNAVALLVLPCLTLYFCGAFIAAQPLSVSLPGLLFALASLGGCIVAALIVWHEIDEYNPVARQLCQSNQEVNCKAILHSGASKIFGISWSYIGLVFFAGILLSLVSGGIDFSKLQLAAWLNLFALPYVFFSIYYQWRVAKQWCVLCLLTQGLLVLQCIAALAGNFYHRIDFASMDMTAVYQLAVSFIVIALVAYLLIPALKKAVGFRKKTIQFERLKRNTQIFEALLSKQKPLQVSPQGLGIRLGNPEGKFRLIKVCNPYCHPCAKAHPLVDDLVDHNPDVHAQIIFTSSKQSKEPVLHFLAIAAKNDTRLTRTVLDDWYNGVVTTYAALIEKYPVTQEELDRQEPHFLAMKDWCNAMEITSTPTFFINGFQLPAIYSVGDLPYFLID